MNVVGVFAHIMQAEDAIGALERAGINRDDISLVAQRQPSQEASGTKKERTAGFGAGAALGGVAGALLGLAAFSIPGIGPIVAGGPIAAAFGAAGAGAAAGGVIGALTGLNVPENDAQYYAEQVRRGSALVIVRALDNGAAQRAREALDAAGARSASDVTEASPSGSRLYDVDGLEFDTPVSSFEDFRKS
ncbi:MAG TPA: hypothetical protein VFA04_03280 [Bryobacteraceae bacterium]|nr:hypothetical protein [Bryobacteraceae bacterium]